jgi:hypothetical protein
MVVRNYAGVAVSRVYLYLRVLQSAGIDVNSQIPSVVYLSVLWILASFPNDGWMAELPLDFAAVPIDSLVLLIGTHSPFYFNPCSSSFSGHAGTTYGP